MKKNAITRNTKRYKRKTNYKKSYRRAGPTRGIPRNPADFQILNAKKSDVFKFKETIQINDIVGTGAGVASVERFNIGQSGRIAALISMFNQYRITKAVYHFRCKYLDTTDTALIPAMYVKYNYDPDLLSGVITEDWALKQSNVVLKQFLTSDSRGTTLTYTVKPAQLVAYKLYLSTNYVPSPVFNKWTDFDPVGTTSETDHLGLWYYIPVLVTGQSINMDLELHYECRDLK